MKLVVVSHKRCWADSHSESGYSTYGGFPLQMKAISELFNHTKLVLPLVPGEVPAGSVPLTGNEVEVHPLPLPGGADLKRKIAMLLWIPLNLPAIWRIVRESDAVHTPVPGDIGMIGMIVALLLRKPLFVRHGGNWLVDASLMRKVLRWMMERFAGGKRVMYATGYNQAPPSQKNSAIKWIFSTSLTEAEINESSHMRSYPDPGAAKLIIVCRQDPGKNVDSLIKALAILRKESPRTCLSVVGDGVLMDHNRAVAVTEGVEDAVIFHGKLDHDGVMKQLQDADVFVFPTDSEGFPKSLLEALASGLPAASTAESVIPHLLSNGSGVLMDDTSPQSIVAAVSAALSDKSSFESMSARAIECAKEYTIERWRKTVRQDLESAWNVTLQEER